MEDTMERKNPPAEKIDETGPNNETLVRLALLYANKTIMAKSCQELAALFAKLPPALEVIPRGPAPASRKKYWSADEDAFIARQYEAGLPIARIAEQLATNRWAIRKRIRQLGLPDRED